MSNLAPPPIQEPVTDQEGFPSVPWIMFFNSVFQGDYGTDWTPVFASLTSVGTPTITGNYKLISRQLVFFRITVTPATSTTATAGTTAVTNFPATFSNNGIVFALANNSGTNSGVVNATDNKIYVPAWSAITTPVTIIGLAEVR